MNAALGLVFLLTFADAQDATNYDATNSYSPDYNNQVLPNNMDQPFAGMVYDDSNINSVDPLDYDEVPNNINPPAMNSLEYPYNIDQSYPINGMEDPPIYFESDNFVPNNDNISPEFGSADDDSNVNIISPGQFQEYSDYEYNTEINPNYDTYPEEPMTNQGAAGYYVPVCDVETCKRSCYEYLGYLIENGALCFNNECYCKEDPDEQSVTQTIIENTSSLDINTDAPTDTDVDDNWDYKKQGDWPKACKEPNSSPIEIDLDTDGPFERVNSSIRFHNYDANVALIAENNGHGVELYVQGKGLALPEIEVISDAEDSGSGQSEVFTLARIDLHWAKSEHKIVSSNESNKVPKFAMEAHLHHFNMRRYEGYDQAVEDEDDGTLSIAVLFTHAMEHMSHMNKTNENPWNQLYDHMDNITDPYEFALLPKDRYLSNFPNHLNIKYADYIGSETSPPCRHNIRWIVSYCSHGFSVTMDQIHQLQKLLDTKGNRIFDNVAKLPKARNETTDPNEETDCTPKGSLGECERCIHANQCTVGHCCPYMRLCVDDSPTIKNSTFCDYVETAGCEPPCYDGNYQTSCNCRNNAFPSKWGKPTCKDASDDLNNSDRTSEKPKENTSEDYDDKDKLDTQYRKMQLEKHNMYRATHKSPPMSLDDKLNKEAEAHAGKLAAERNWLSKSDHDNNTRDGENLGLSCSSSSYPEFDDVTDKWYNEEKDYDYNTGDVKQQCKDNIAACYSKDGVGHFTQVVWKDSIKLGIGKATGKIDQMFCTWAVGRYAPAGNVMGKFQENVLKP